MSQRRDDTTEPCEQAPAAPTPAPGRYYYDDATGYEPYDPTQDEEDDDSEEQPVVPVR